MSELLCGKEELEMPACLPETPQPNEEPIVLVAPTTPTTPVSRGESPEPGEAPNAPVRAPKRRTFESDADEERAFLQGETELDRLREENEELRKKLVRAFRFVQELLSEEKIEE